ncbi:MAG: phospholipid/cholesterol/gamma-HCH transport system substrate-binding protein [Frankiaceae bacterium]|nr:phospholipid/cholesterol/gamma-HCH transport system substrate-binding protein [Frankiaceae bacterium]
MALLVPPPLKRAAAGSKRKLQGVAFLLAIALMLYLVVALYNKQFVKTIPVSLQTNSIGNQLALNADVKFRGVNVGDVRVLTTNGEVATLKLAMKPDQIRLIPADVQARILPKTLFGQKYVELVSPSEGQGVRTLHKGDVITQDRTRTGIEIEQLYDNLLPFITTVAPEKLNSTLTAIATALEGRGDKLGDNLARLDDYLRQINQHLPAIQEDVSGLADYSQILNDAAPDLLRFLDNSVVTSRTLVEKQDTLAQFLANSAGAADTGSAVLSENRDRLIQAPQLGEEITRTLARRSANLPLIFNGLAGLVDPVHQVFGTGENKNWLHISLSIVGQKGAYTQADCPKNLTPDGDQFGPNCPGGGSNSQTGASAGSGTATPVPSAAVGATPAPSATASSALTGSALTTSNATEVTDLTVDSVGSPEEKALIQRIVGTVNAEQTATHDMSPDLANLFLGPMFRGTEVTFK